MGTCAPLPATAFHAGAHLRALIESTEDLIWSVDLNYRLLTFNRAFYDHFERNFGVRAVAGMRPEDMLPPARAALWTPLYERALSEGPFQAEYSLIDSRTLELAFNPIVQDGETTGISVFGKDISERKAAEDKLRESERRLLTVMETVSLVGVILDRQGNITLCNDYLLALTGWKREEVLGRNWFEIFIPPEIYGEVYQEVFLKPIDKGEIPVHYRNEIVTRAGERRMVEWNNTVIRDLDGQVASVASIGADITQRKRAEEALRQTNRKLQQLSRDLLRSQDYERRRIARELHDSTSQLLAALSINLGRLRDSELKPGRREQVLSEAIGLAAACAAEIRTTTYLLHPPLLEEVGLVDAVRTYVQGFNQRTGIQVKIKIPLDFGRLGNEMETALFRIIQEGLANVHRHSGSRSAVLWLARDPCEVRLVLQDQGRGFTEAPHRPAKGFVHLGVGITGMRERAEQLGGRLELASGDTGTRLTVTLPMVQSNEETADLVSG